LYTKDQTRYISSHNGLIVPLFLILSYTLWNKEWKKLTIYTSFNTTVSEILFCYGLTHFAIVLWSSASRFRLTHPYLHTSKYFSRYYTRINVPRRRPGHQVVELDGENVEIGAGRSSNDNDLIVVEASHLGTRVEPTSILQVWQNFPLPLSIKKCML
jgi:hypothetical protein